MALRLPILVLVLGLSGPAGLAGAQPAPPAFVSQIAPAASSGPAFDYARSPSTVSARKAFGLSLILPGLGHRHANGGRWGGSGTFFALTDAVLWAGLTGTLWRRDHLVTSYRTLAVTGAGADMANKERLFELRMASFRSTEEFREVSLRNRLWEDLAWADDPANYWDWTREADYLRFRELREDAESLGRRRTALIATLVANRLLSGFLAARSARSRRGEILDLALRPSPAGSIPVVDLAVRF